MQLEMSPGPVRRGQSYEQAAIMQQDGMGSSHLSPSKRTLFFFSTKFCSELHNLSTHEGKYAAEQTRRQVGIKVGEAESASLEPVESKPPSTPAFPEAYSLSFVPMTMAPHSSHCSLPSPKSLIRPSWGGLW